MDKFFLSFFLSWFFSCVSYAQSGSTESETTGLDHELIYLQTDKGVYERGEDLWFKSYTMDAQSLALSDRSKTLFVEMLNADDSIVWQEMYPVFSGIADGHIYIDKNLDVGDYRIHAYTRLSFLNDTARPIYAKKIRVVKDIVNRRSKSRLRKDPSDIRISFFPEGGNLINGITSKVAFMARDGEGLPLNVKGVLLENGKEVARLKTIHDGMGSLFVLPQKESSYKVVLDNGQEFPFAEVSASGLSVHLRKQTDDDLEFHLFQSGGASPQTVTLEGKMRGILCCRATGILREKLKVRIPLTEFPMQGIAEFTLYDEKGLPMAERLVYVHPGRKLHIELKTDSDRYITRGKGKLGIKVTDETGKPVQAHLGLSLFDHAYRNEANPENMLSHCLLSTEIKGNIHNPAYYFDDDNKDRTVALDLLLLTQGWRRYIWVNSNRPAAADAFLSDEIRGRQNIGKKNKLKELGDSQQLLQVSGSNTGNCFIIVDSLGQFELSAEQMLALRGGYVYLKPMLDKDKYKPVIAIEQSFDKADSLRKSCSIYLPYLDPAQVPSDSSLYSHVSGQDGSILLDELTITGKKERVFRDKMMGRLDSLAQMNSNAYVCTSCGLLLNYRSDYQGHHAVGACPAKGRKQPVIGKTYRLAKYKHQTTGPNPYFDFVDELYVVYEGPVYSEEELLEMNNIRRAKGYYGKREFYQPDELDMQSPIPDARNVLLWKPDIITDEKGEAEVEFFCSDINTGFVGVIEGTDGVGNLGSSQCEFNVHKP